MVAPQPRGFFRELVEPNAPADTGAWPSSEAAIQRLLGTSEGHGYWDATPEKNATVGGSAGPR